MFMDGPVEFVCFTERAINEWRRSKNVPDSIYESFVNAVNEYQSDIGESDALIPRLKVVMSEACWRVVNGYLDHVSVVQFLESVLLPSDSSGILAVALADVLWGVSLGVQSFETDTDEWAVLCSFVSQLNDNVVAANTFKGILDDNLIQSIGLVPSLDEFNRTLKKRYTSLVYRQRKFNLFREENEGFSKLLVLFYSACDPLQNDLFGNVEELKERAHSLMGTFDLDPNRCLDILLDSLEAHPDSTALLKFLEDFTSGSITHILGFKFAFYRRPSVRDRFAKARLTPSSLYRLAALLISGDIVKLDSVLAHLEPSLEIIKEHQDALGPKVHKVNRDDASMKQRLQNATRNIAAIKRIDPSRRASTRQSASISVKAPKSSPTNKSTLDKISTPENQIVDFLVASLRSNIWKVACPLLQRFTNAGIQIDRFPNVVDSLCDAAHDILDPSYVSDPFVSGYTYKKPEGKKNHPLLAKLCGNSRKRPLSETMKGTNPLTIKDKTPWWADSELIKPLKAGSKVVKESTERRPRISSFDISRANLLYSILKSLGLIIADDPSLYAKLCRVLSSVLRENPSGNLRSKVIDILQYYVLPSLELQHYSAAAALEAWSALKFLSFEERYHMYGQWYLDVQSGDRPRRLRESNVRAEQDAKEFTQHLNSATKDTHDARMLAKATHAHPILVDRLIGWLEAYDNFVPLIVDSMRLLSSLTFDVCTCFIVRRFVSSEKKLISDSGLGNPSWLTNLAAFTGQLYKKYGCLEIQGLLHMLTRSLADGGDSVSRIAVLREILLQMGGIPNFEESTAEQLEGKAGSQALRTISHSFGGPATLQNPRRTTVRALFDALQENQTLLPLLVYLPRQRTNILYEGAGKGAGNTSLFSSTRSLPLKLVGVHADTMRATHHQLVEFGTQPLVAAQFAEICPRLSDMVENFGVDTPDSMVSARLMLREGLFREWGLGKCASNDTTKPKLPSMDQKSISSLLLPQSILDSWNFQSQDVISALATMLPTKIRRYITPRLFMIFWSLKLYDLHVPKAEYSNQADKLKLRISEMKAKEKDTVSGRTSARAYKIERDQRAELDKVITSVSQLNKDLKEQTVHVQNIFEHLASESTALLGPDAISDPTSASNAILEYMIMPRVLQGQEDALYTAKFIAALQMHGVVGFPIVPLLGKGISRSANMLYLCTEMEASSIGIFIKECINVSRKWGSSSKDWDKTMKKDIGDTREEFIRKLEYWSSVVNDTLRNCIQNQEYLVVKSALLALKNMIDAYPWRHSDGVRLMDAFSSLVKKDSNGNYLEQRDDIRVIAFSLHARLRLRLPTMLMPNGKTFAEDNKKKNKSPTETKYTSRAPSSHADKESSRHHDSKHRSDSRTRSLQRASHSGHDADDQAALKKRDREKDRGGHSDSEGQKRHRDEPPSRREHRTMEAPSKSRTDGIVAPNSRESLKSKVEQSNLEKGWVQDFTSKSNIPSGNNEIELREHVKSAQTNAEDRSTLIKKEKRVSPSKSGEKKPNLAETSDKSRSKDKAKSSRLSNSPVRVPSDKEKSKNIVLEQVETNMYDKRDTRTPSPIEVPPRKFPSAQPNPPEESSKRGEQKRSRSPVDDDRREGKKVRNYDERGVPGGQFSGRGGMGSLAQQYSGQGDRRVEGGRGTFPPEGIGRRRGEGGSSRGWSRSNRPRR